MFHCKHAVIAINRCFQWSHKAWNMRYFCSSGSLEEFSGTALQEIRQARVGKISKLEAIGMTSYNYSFDSSHKTTTLHSEFSALACGHQDATFVSVAGRIMMRRSFGKLSFYKLQDGTGSIQLYLDKKLLGEEVFDQLENLVDCGDIVGARGTLKRTNKGELSVVVSSWTMLTKALMPLPEKFHGLVDVNKRYRQRHLDMITNETVRKVFQTRSLIISSIRNMLDSEGFLEVETPILSHQPGGANARPFATHHNALDLPLTLRIATELHLKRMVVGGFERVYEIGRIFRNEGLSTRHNPEFTSIELYQAYADYNDMMSLAEQLVVSLVHKLNKDLNCKEEVTYQGQTLNFSRPWRRVTMHDIVQQVTGVDFKPFTDTHDYAAARRVAIEQLHVAPHLLEGTRASTAGEVLNVIFEEFCEKTLFQPTFVTDYPLEVSPLSKCHRSKPGLVERFELFIAGREHANAFSELTDPREQRQRLEQQALKKAQGDAEACEVDEDFLQALESGMPPTAGMGIGIDRLVMILTDSASIKDVIAFPLLRP